MSPIRELDVFVTGAGEIVCANVHPAIGNVIDVRENFLIHHDLIRFTRMPDRIERAFSGGVDRGDADIDRI